MVADALAPPGYATFARGYVKLRLKCDAVREDRMKRLKQTDEDKAATADAKAA